MLHEKLREREIDLAISRMNEPDAEDDLHAEILFQDQLVVVAGKQNALVSRRRLLLKDLMEERWILGPPEGSYLSQFIEEAFNHAQLAAPRPTVTTVSTHVRNSLLIAGPFLTILPTAMLKYPGPHPSLSALSVKLPTTRRPVGLVRLKHRGVSPIASVFTIWRE
jgi:DNA-binding transcriptional LysR family regulator